LHDFSLNHLNINYSSIQKLEGQGLTFVFTNYQEKLIYFFLDFTEKLIIIFP